MGVACFSMYIVHVLYRYESTYMYGGMYMYICIHVPVHMWYSDLEVKPLMMMVTVYIRIQY